MAGIFAHLNTRTKTHVSEPVRATMVKKLRRMREGKANHTYLRMSYRLKQSLSTLRLPNIGEPISLPFLN